MGTKKLTHQMRYFYTTLFTTLLPIIIARLFWRSIKAPDYRQRIPERLGFYKKSSQQKSLIWIHAVSVGEVEAAFPLIKNVQQYFPNHKILVTTTTPTGSARVQAVLAETVEHVYLPYDIPFAIGRFLETFQPCLAIIMETEIWPNLYQGIHQQNIPLLLVNARLSENSKRGYLKIPRLVKPALACIDTIAAQTADDAKRFIEIGAKADNVQVVGNIKFDLEVAENLINQGKQLKSQTFPQRLVWLIASTHKGEEQVFLEAYQQLKPKHPSLLLVIVPRHPERFKSVKKLAEQAGLKVINRTDNPICQSETDVYLADTMGELKMLYASADLTFVAGSVEPIGGHNVLEPAALGIPVMFGHYMHNFKDIARDLLAVNGAVQCHNSEEIISEAERLLNNASARHYLAERSQVFVKTNRGALERVLTLIVETI